MTAVLPPAGCAAADGLSQRAELLRAHYADLQAFHTGVGLPEEEEDDADFPAERYGHVLLPEAGPSDQAREASLPDAL